MTACALFFDAKGSPYDRGFAVGTAYCDDIRAHLSAWHGALAAGGVLEPAQYIDQLLADTQFLADTRLATPHLVEELEGVAEGANMPFADIFALQLIDEEWAYRSDRPAAFQSRDKCSSLAFASMEGGPAWAAQNMDLGAYTDGLQMLVRHSADSHGPAQLVFTLAGHLGLMGVNEAGVALCCNSLPQLPSARKGIPVAFAVRRVLEAHNAQEASAIVRSLDHATNQHYLIADADAIISLEASAAGVTEYRPESAGRVLHTNHPLSGVREVNAPGEKHRANSEGRLDALAKAFPGPTADFHAIAAALADIEGAHPLCRLRSDEPGLINFTTGSIVTPIEKGRPMQTYVAFGPPNANAYRRYSFGDEQQGILA